MRFIVVVVAALLTESLTLPVAREGQREDVMKRCLVEVLSKALSTSDSLLDQECREILQAGIKHASLEKKSPEGNLNQEEVIKSHNEEPTPKAADVKDIEALLKSVEAKRQTPEDERSQESWSLGDEKDKRHGDEEEETREKRSGWRPGRVYQRKYKRGEAEEDYDRSQESWGGVEKRSEEEEEDEESEEREKRNWRPGRHHQRKHKRDGEGEEDKPEEERSQENWDVDKRQGDEDEEERSKRIWKPTHRYHHKKKLHKRSDEPSEGEEYEDRSQESWDVDKRDWRPGRHHQRRHKRDEELSEEAGEEPEEERSQEYWDFDSGRDKRDWRPGRYHQRRHKRDEELPEEAREEPEEERSQEYWDFDTGREKRNWRPGRHHQRRHKRDEDEDLAEEERQEPDGERSQEYWGFEKRHGKEEGEIEKRIWKPTHRYHHKKKLHKRDEGSSEEEEDPRGGSEEYTEETKDRDEALRYLAEKRNPWIYRGFYHPAWFKRDTGEPASNKMDEVARLLNYKINQLSNHPTEGEAKRTLSPQEEKKLENLAAMDMELQKIAAKLHDKV